MAFLRKIKKPFLIFLALLLFLGAVIGTIAFFTDRVGNQMEFTTSSFEKEGYSLTRIAPSGPFSAGEDIVITLNEQNTRTDQDTSSVISMSVKWEGIDSSSSIFEKPAPASITLEGQAISYTVQKDGSIGFDLPSHLLKKGGEEQSRSLVFHIPDSPGTIGNLSFRFDQVVIKQAPNGFSNTYSNADLNKAQKLDFMVKVGRIVGIQVTKEPDKTSYDEGSNFAPDGMEVSAVYADGSKLPITGFTITNGSNLPYPQTSVNVSYTDPESGNTYTTTTPITVNPRITGIRVELADKSKSFYDGFSVSRSDLIVNAVYKDDSSKVITDYTITNGDKLKLDQDFIEVEHTSGNTTFKATTAITVKPVLKDIAVTTPPSTTVYLEGDNFDPKGMIVTANYTDGSSKVITSYSLSNNTNLAYPSRNIGIKYSESYPVGSGSAVVERSTSLIVEVLENHPVLAPKQTWYQSSYDKTSITEINIVNSYSGAVSESWNAGEDADGDGNSNADVKVYRNGTVLNIVGDGSGTIYTNPNSAGAFKDFESATSINGLEHLDTRFTENMSAMFAGCQKITSLDVTKFNTSKVTDMEDMFRYCRQLTSLDVSSFNTSKVTTMRGMFSAENTNVEGVYSSKLANIVGMDDWDTSKVTDMTDMFVYCIDLIDAGDLGNWDVSNVVNAARMFHRCYELKELHLCGWDLSSLNTDAKLDSGLGDDHMFEMYSDVGLTVLVANQKMKDWAEGTPGFHATTVNVIPHESVLWLAKNSTWYDTSVKIKSAITKINIVDSYAAPSGSTRVGAWPAAVYGDRIMCYVDTVGSDTILTIAGDGSGSICENLSFKTTDSKIYANPDSENHFNNFTKVTEIKGMNNLNTSNVASMYGMFRDCQKLTSVDLSGFDTSKVTAMNYMFYNCYALTELDLSSFNTRSLTSMQYMFNGCRTLQKVSLGSDFAWVGTNGYLPEPNSNYITGADGNWYNSAGIAFSRNTIPSNTADTYYAFEPAINPSKYTITYNLDGGRISTGSGLGNGDTIDWFSSSPLYLVSSATPTEADLAKGYSITATSLKDGSKTTVTEAEAPYQVMEGYGILIGDAVIIVPEPITIEGMSIPKGTYFMSDSDLGMFVSSFTIKGYSGFGGGDTFDWFVLNNFYKVSDAVPTMDDLANGYSATVTFRNDGSTVTGTNADYSFEEIEGVGYHCLYMVVIIPEDVTMDGITIPKGTYFASDNSTYVSSFTVNNYTGFGDSGKSNPTSYTKGSEDITLINPTKSGYTFLGWIGSNGDTPEKNVTIASGSTGNKEFTAVWEKNTTAYAIYSEDDDSLRFYYTKEDIVEGEDYNGLEATTVYENINLSGYKSYSSVPWYVDGNYLNIKTVVFEDESLPITNLENYFYGCSGLTNLSAIPSTVTKIGNYAFYGCSALGDLTIPESVTSIGTNAFNGCSGLTKVIIPDSVIDLGSSAFYGCTGLSSVSLSESLTKLNNQVFYGCTSLKEITIPDGVTSIGGNAFYGCSKLAKITLPASVTTLGSSAFPSPSSSFITGATGKWFDVSTDKSYYASSLPTGVAATYVATAKTTYAVYSEDDNSLRFYYDFADVEEGKDYNGIKATVVYKNISLSGYTSYSSVPWYADGNYANITKVVFENKNIPITNLAYYFYKCSKLSEIPDIPTNVTQIGTSAFEGCSRMTGPLFLSDKITFIGNSAFKNCSNLSGTLTIPDSVTDMYASAFQGCSGFSGTLTISKNLNRIASNAFSNCSGLSSVIIPDGITSIEGNAFYECSGLEGEMIIPDSVTTIGNSAFGYCSGLTSVEFGSGITSLGWQIFINCTGINSVTISEGMKTIGDGMFYGCKNLSSITLPASVTSITPSSSGTFAIPSPSSSYIPGADGKWHNAETGESYAPTDIPMGVAATYVAVPGSRYAVYSADDNSLRFYTSIKEIVEGEDYNGFEATNVYKNFLLNGYSSASAVPWYNDGTYANIEKVVFEDKSIDIRSLSYYFYGCSDLTSINIPESVQNIGRSAFEGCSSLTDIVIPEGIKSLGSHTFKGCSSLASLILPESVTALGDHVFQDCSNLKSVNIPDGVTEISDWAFYNCHRLESLAIPDSVTEISGSAFANCYGITSLTIPGSVSKIEDGTFMSLTGLKNIVFEEGVVTLGDNLFLNCTSLSSMTLPASLTSYSGNTFLVPSNHYIPGADGKWYNAQSGDAYTVTTIPIKTAATYVAVYQKPSSVVDLEDSSVQKTSPSIGSDDNQNMTVEEESNSSLPSETKEINLLTDDK